MSKFMPGPWDKLRNEDGLYFTRGMTKVNDEVKWFMCSIYGSKDYDHSGTARLIVAAPEMYEKLNDFVSEVEAFLTVYDTADVFNDEFFDLVEATKELLARIDGEASND